MGGWLNLVFVLAELVKDSTLGRQRMWIQPGEDLKAAADAGAMVFNHLQIQMKLSEIVGRKK